MALASAETSATGIAVDDDDVYFAVTKDTNVADDFDIWRVSRFGGPAVEFAEGPSGSSLTINATAVFTWSRDGFIRRWAKSGGAPTILYQHDPHDRVLAGFADAFGYIYFLTSNLGDFYLSRTPEDGGGPDTSVATGMSYEESITDFAFDPHHLWLAHPVGISGTAPDGGGPSISMSWSPTPPPNQPPPYLEHVAADDTYVYASTSAGDVLRAAQTDGAPFTVIGHPSGLVSAVRTDGGHVYVSSESFVDGRFHTTITRFSSDGASADVLVDGDTTFGDFAFRGDSLYYTSLQDSTVYRVCK